MCTLQMSERPKCPKRIVSDISEAIPSVRNVRETFRSRTFRTVAYRSQGSDAGQECLSEVIAVISVFHT
jgi:hypothetical protein